MRFIRVRTRAASGDANPPARAYRINVAHVVRYHADRGGTLIHLVDGSSVPAACDVDELDMLIEDLGGSVEEPE